MKISNKIFLSILLCFSMLVISGISSKAITIPPLVGSAMKFDGNDDYINFGTTNLGSFSSGFTFETWVKWDSLSTNSTLLNFSTNSSWYRMMIGNYQKTDSLSISINNYYENSIIIPDVIDTSTWMHIALTISSSGDAKVYINGVLKNGCKINVPTNSSRNTCYIGRNESVYFKGKLDEMRIWNTERSEANILAYINDTVPYNSANLKMYYKFDEGTGTVLKDSSINNFNGTLINFDLTKAWIPSYAIIQPILRPLSKLSDASFTINWNPVAKASGYHIEYSVNQDFSGATTVNPGNVTSYQISGLTPLTKYYYRINCTSSVTSNYTTANITTLPSTMTIPGNALKFDGNNGYVDCGNNIDLSNKSFTIEFWAKRPISSNLFYVLGHGNNDQQLCFYFTFSNVTFRYRNTFLGSSSPNDTLWHHYAASLNKSAMMLSLYIDGKLAKTTAVSEVYAVAGNFSIGKVPYYSYNYYNGQLDEVRVWSDSKSQSQIAANMNDTVDQDSPGLIGYWKFDMVAGSINVPDHSAYGNTGTLININATTSWKPSYAIIQPVMKPITNITANSFKVNWYPVLDASTTFNLDVDDNPDFSSPLASYNNLNVGTATSYTISGLSSGLVYYCRVRANSTKTSNYSTPITAITLFSAPKYVTPGNALYLSSYQEYVNCGDSIRLNNQSFTIEFWAKIKNNQGGYIFSQGQESSNSLLYASIRQDKLMFGNYNDGISISCSTDTSWHHYAYIHDVSHEEKLYRDGILIAENTSYYNFNDSGTFFLGSRRGENNSNFTGQLDEMRIWSGTRSITDLLAYMNDTVRRNTQGLKAYWRFDTIPNSPFLVADYSVKKNNGVIQKFDNIKDFSKSKAIIQPILKPATNVTANSFTISWNPVAGATSYYIDVADTSDFSSLVTGFNNKNVGNVTSYTIRGLNPATVYYYRVSSENVETSEKAKDYVFTKATPVTMKTPGKAISLDGINDYIDCGDNINLSNKSFTIEFWAKTPIGNYFEVFNYGSSNLNNSLKFILHSANYQIAINGDNYEAQVEIDTSWHHYACSFNNSAKSIKLYYDGRLMTSKYVYNSFVETGKFLIGKYISPNNNMFKGEIDEFKVWGNERTQEQIISYMNDTVNRNSAGLLAYYRFDSQEGETVVADYSVNNNNAGLMNMDKNKSFVASNAIIQPFMKPATSVTDTCFTLNWLPVANASSYYLDIDDNIDFSSPLSGYSNLNVGNITQFTVNLPGSAYNYYCRVRSNSSKISQNANPVQVMSQHGNALHFAGDNDYIVVASNDSLNLTTKYTLELWIKPDGFDYEAGIIFKENTYSLSYTNSGNYRGLVFDGLYTSDNILNLGQWYHVAAVNNNGTRHLYVNGIEQTLSGTSSYINSNINILQIGYNYSNYFKGNMEEVRIWNTARTVEEINYYSNRILKGNEKGLVLYLNFDAGIADNNNTNCRILPNVSDFKFKAALFNFDLVGENSNFVVSDLKNIHGYQGLIANGVSNLGLGSITVNAEIFDKGLSNATARGVCYGTNKDVTIKNAHVSETGSFGIGSFSTIITGLAANTVYYAKAYSISPEGISYSNVISFEVPGYNKDMGICGVFSDGSPYTAAEKLSIVIKNKGVNVQTNVPVSFLLNGIKTTETYAGNLKFNETDTFTFSHTFDLSAPGVLNITASVDLPGDENSANDTIKDQFSQPSEKVVGTSTSTSAPLPIEPYYGYSYSQSIYLQPEVGNAKHITSIAFYYYAPAGYVGLDYSNDWKIYMTKTKKAKFESSTDWIDINNYTLVYDGTIPSPTSSGWIVFNITPFDYDGVSNLAIAVEENQPDYDSNADDFYSTITPENTNRSIYYRSDVTNPDPLAPPSGNIVNYIPNIKFLYGAEQNISFNSFATPVSYGDASFSVSATGGASINPVVFSSSDNSVATCTGTNGKTVKIVGAGTCTIYANQAGNNAYSLASQVGLALTVNKKAISVTADASKTKVYGSTDPLFTYTYTPTLLNGDVFAGKLSRAAGEDIGTYAINIGTLTAGNNYNISLTGSDFTISAKAITLNLSDAISKQYDGTASITINASLNGVVDGDDVYLSNQTGIFADSKIGTGKTITATLSLSGTKAGNYTITQPSLTGSITPKELTVTGATVAPKVYDGTTATTISGATLSGVVGSEDVTLGNVTSGAFIDANAGTAKLITTTPFTISGTSVDNYTLIQPIISGDITKAELIVTANDKSRCFNIANPAFDYTISGFVNNETSSVIDTQPVAKTTAIQSSAAGTYPITVSGGEDNNYTFKYVNGQLTVNSPATPVITANNKTLHSDATIGNQWYNDNGSITGVTNQDYTTTSAGKYFVIVTVDGCSSDSSNVITIEPHPSALHFADFKINIYPNPVSDVLQISTDELNENASYSIFTLTGGKLVNGKMIKGKAMVNMEKYSSGTYILRITFGKYTNEYKIVKK